MRLDEIKQILKVFPDITHLDYVKYFYKSNKTLQKSILNFMIIDGTKKGIL